MEARGLDKARDRESNDRSNAIEDNMDDDVDDDIDGGFDSRCTGWCSYGDVKKQYIEGPPRHFQRTVRELGDLSESVEEGREVGDASNLASTYSNQGGRKAGGTGDGDPQAQAQGQSPTHADEHGQPRF